MENRQVKRGIVLSYGTIIINMLAGVLLTPFLIKNLGAVEFGLYQLIASFAGMLLILDFGIGATAIRYVALYSSKNDKSSVENVAMHCLIIAGILAVIVLIASVIIYMWLPYVYREQFSELQLQKLQLLFMISSINIIVVIFEHVISGVIAGLNLFSFTKGAAFLRVIFRTIILLILVSLGMNSIAIVATDLFLTCCLFLLSLFYLISIQKIIPRLAYIDKPLLGDLFKYSTLSFLQSFASH
jgi:O-antigen/teichoic acid export membrane protein